MSRLPARTGADVHLADAFGRPGCPLCAERSRLEEAYLEAILAESVNDVPFRKALDAGRGFCAAHSRAVLAADRERAGSLGAAILLRATLVVRLRELETLHAAGGWARARRAGDASRAPACPACRRVAEADGALVEGLVRLAEDAAWADAVAAAPFCLDHLVALVDRRSPPPWWPPIEGRQVERLRDIRDRLDRFAHASAHDRRHLQTPDQLASVDEAADLLGGAAPRRGSGPTPPDARALLVTGVYGAGKSTVTAELVERLDTAGVAVAGIDLDWLGWYAAPVAWDEHEDARMVRRNLAAMRDAYLEIGVRTFVLAGAAREADAVERLRGVLRMPMDVVRLEVDGDTVRRRLEGDPTFGRRDDLEVALRDLQAAAPDGGALAVDGRRPPADVAAEILELVGWSPDP
jgi:adenylylsulfate kinase-like enzyme